MPNWKQAFLVHYTATQQTSFKQFRLGVMLFFLGMVIVYIGMNLWQPSLQQEMILAAGLIFGGIGFIWALMAQMRMVISRFVRFFSEKKHD